MNQMKKIYLLFGIISALSLSSCNDWLDVRPETEQKAEDQFSSTGGFCDALTGTYMSMGSQDIYGERLSMTNIESLANLWYMDETETRRNEDLDLKRHTYNTTYAEDAIEAIYAQLFNVVAQANMVIKNVDENGGVVQNPAMRAVLQGEAYAIRAYCQLDVLRLFGQLPAGGTQAVSLPYSETTSIEEMPSYYDFNAYVEKLKYDIAMAESLLKDNDPVFQYSFAELNSAPAGLDDFFYYRQSRMNYWAVKALEARMLLYVGEKDEAYRVAREVIDATLEGEPVMEMSGPADFTAGYTLCPSECLFYLSKYDVMDYSSSVLIGGNMTVQYSPTSNLAITHDMRDELYAEVGAYLGSHNRYLHQWNNNIRDAYQRTYSATTKYYWDEDEANNLMTCHQLVPMLRMSEVYLIAMEAAPTLEEANALFQAYMIAHEVPNAADFQSMEELPAFVLSEYRREFFAEGQAFYTYKRMGAEDMLWCEEPVEEADYILPLPITEYNPNR